MRVRVTISKSFTDEEVAALVWYGRQDGIDYGNPSSREIVKRLLQQYGDLVVMTAETELAKAKKSLVR